MTSEPSFFSDYEDPPVTEVALSVQFQHLRELRTPHLGLLWNEYRKKGLTKVREHEPLDPAFELFDDERLVPGQIVMTNIPPIPRIWYLNDKETELVQIQQDRFILNWRRVSIKKPYPRYPKIKKSFIEYFKLFSQFIKQNDLGEITPNQSEVTYVNPIPAEEKWKTADDLHRVIRVLKSQGRSDFLPDLDDINLGLRYIIRDKNGVPQGRLYISLQPATSMDNKQVFLLRLTARGRPIGEGIDGVLSFMDIGHEWIVRGFTSITTDIMHKKWGIKE